MLDFSRSGTKGTYKSPIRKLVTFFENSRNQWKAKCKEAKKTIKRLKNRIRFLERSKALLKSRVKELEAELEAELARVKPNKDGRQRELKKSAKQVTKETKGIGYFGSFTPSCHTYSAGHIMLFVLLVLSSATSLRGASRSMKIVISFLGLEFSIPSWFSGRLWLLRLGYYKLMREKEKANDWVWIVDHTVQVGTEKCLVILGIRLYDLPAPGSCLTHEDVEPIDLIPMKHSNGQVVFEQLSQTIEKTGVPRAIVGDHGSDIKSGVERFCEEHDETCYIYDIKHKTAAILKRELRNDGPWQEFVQLAAKTKKRVQQTSIAHLAPPNQRSKARYMNVDSLIQWGSDALAFVDKHRPEANKTFDQKQVDEKLGWVTEFRIALEEWEELLRVVTTVECFVREEGIFNGCDRELEKIEGLESHTERTKRVRDELLAFVEEQSLQAKPNERLLGSSEVIESVLGKLKRLEQNQAKSGFTGLVLSVGAIVSKNTVEVVQKAMEAVRTTEVTEWCKETLGQSVQSKRRQAFASP
jgi:hypothetical protein